MIVKEAPRIIILLLSANQAVYQSDQDAQLDSWIPKAPNRVSIFHLLGLEGSPSQVVGSKLYVDCSDNAILVKTIIGIKYCLDNYQFDYLVRSNTSTFFDVSSLGMSLRGKSKQGFGGYWDLYGDSKEPFVTGTGMFFSNYAAKALVEAFPSFYDNTIADDVAISRIMLQTRTVEPFSIKRKSLNASHIVTSHFYVRCKDSETPSRTSIRIKKYSDYYFSRGCNKIYLFIKIQTWELSYITPRIKGMYAYFSTIINLLLQYWRNRKISKFIHKARKS